MALAKEHSRSQRRRYFWSLAVIKRIAASEDENGKEVRTFFVIYTSAELESAGRVIQLPRSGLLHIKRVSVKADLIVKTSQYLRIM